MSNPIWAQQSLLFTLIDQLQDYYIPNDTGTTTSIRGGVVPNSYPKRLMANEILKNCVPSIETLITRNRLSDMHLFYLKQLIYSAMTPDLRFFKVKNTKDKDTGKIIREVVECEFPRSLRNNIAGTPILNNSTTDLDFSRPVTQRGGQIGVTGFNWNYIGTDYFTAERDIEAELTMTMDGIGALAAERVNRKGQHYRLMDLLLQADCFEVNKKKAVSSSAATTPSAKEAAFVPSNSPLKYDAGCYEILVEAGYLVDDDRMDDIIKKMNFQSSISGVKWPFEAEKIRKELKNLTFKKMRSCMYLTVVDHKFDFQENGKVTCVVNYRARSSIAQRQPETNIIYAKKDSTSIEQHNDSIEVLEGMIKTIKAKQPVASSTISLLASYGLVTLAEANAAAADLEKAEEQLKKLKEQRQKIYDSAKSSFLADVLTYLKSTPTTTVPTSTTTGGASTPHAKIFSVETTLQQSNLFSAFVQNPDSTTLNNFLASMGPPTGYIKTYSAGTSTNLNTAVASDPNLVQPNVSTFFTTAAGDTVPYAYFGDILDAVLVRSGVSKFDTYRYILGNIKMLSPTTGKEFFMSIGSIPISIPTLRSVIEKQIKARQKNTLSFLGFIDMMLRNVVKESLGQEATKVALGSKAARFRTTAFTHYASPANPDPTRTPLQTNPAVNIDLVTLSPNKLLYNNLTTGIAGTMPRVLLNLITGCTDAPFLEKTSKMLNIVCITEESTYDFGKSFGDIQADFLRYIPHFIHGQSYGLIKKATLEKTDLPLQKEQRFTQAVNDGKPNADVYLTNFYNATFEMIGNDLNSLGGYIYFDPFGLAPDGSLGKPNDQTSLAYIMGIGGVHIITAISHKMTPGSYTTSVKTRWENRGVIKQQKSSESK